MNQNGVWLAMLFSLGLAQAAWPHERGVVRDRAVAALDVSGPVARPQTASEPQVAQSGRNLRATDDFLRSQGRLPRNNVQRFVPGRPAYPNRTPPSAARSDNGNSTLAPTAIVVAISIITLASALRLTRQRL